MLPIGNGPKSESPFPDQHLKAMRSKQMSTATAATATATTAAPDSTLRSGTWKIDRVHSHVGFAVKHMVVSTFRGAFEDYDGALRVGEDGTPRLEGWVSVDSINVRD